MQYYVVCRNSPTDDEINRSILDRTDDPHRENKHAASRYAVHMIATVCGCGDICFYPIDPQLVDVMETVDQIVVGRDTEPFEFEGHTWHRVGPLTDEDMEMLASAALGFLLNNCLSGITITALVKDLGSTLEPEESGSLH